MTQCKFCRIARSFIIVAVLLLIVVMTNLDKLGS